MSLTQTSRADKASLKFKISQCDSLRIPSDPAPAVARQSRRRRATTAARHALIIANHDSLLDGLLIGLFLPGAPARGGRRDPQVALVAPAAAAVPCIILDPAQPLAVKRLIGRSARSGGGIFPQGRMSTTGGVMKVYDSAGSSRPAATPISFGRITGTRFSRFGMMGRARRRGAGFRALRCPFMRRSSCRPTRMRARERRRRLPTKCSKSCSA